MCTSRNTVAAAALITVFLAISVCEASCNYVLSGDINKDCRVDFNDFVALAQNWLIDCGSDFQNPACHCDIRWAAEPPMLTGRNSFCGGLINGRIYIFGGNDPDQKDLKSAESYDPNTMQWVEVADNNHNDGQGVEELTSAVVNGKLYVFGAWGWNPSERHSMVINFNEMYDPVTNTWTTLWRKPTTVAAAPATVYKDEIYLFGGYFRQDSDSQSVSYRTVESYRPSNNTWRFVTSMPRDISNMAVATIGDKAYLFGGAELISEDPLQILILDDVITYDFQTGLWDTSGFTHLPVKMAYSYYGAAPIIDGKVYLIGEYEEDSSGYRWSNRIDIYDPVTNTWEKGPSLPMPLDGHVALAIGHKIYALGGRNNWSFKNGPQSGVISLGTRFCSE